ncbi:MAG: calcium/sodium antiporter, partial [Anaerolineales bacterium]|nr:calcium/sodium antiporter [Anaerolineales bacterium]
MTFMPFLLIVGGMALLVVGAEIFVRGAVQLAALIGVSALVIGLTVVAYGTSMPELAVSLQATYAGFDSLAVGNAVGSNIANILLILGLSALVAPLIVSQQLVRLDVPLMIGASFLVAFMALDGEITAVDGLILFTLLIIYTVFLIYQSRRETKAVADEYEQEFGEKPAPTLKNWLLIAAQIVVGVAMLVFGSDFLVEGAVEIAQFFGVSELVIGLTIVAVGTSLPELATSLVASYR